MRKERWEQGQGWGREIRRENGETGNREREELTLPVPDFFYAVFTPPCCFSLDWDEKWSIIYSGTPLIR